ncbi:MAG: ROK family protein [Egibacteraceae bacterium]
MAERSDRRIRVADIGGTHVTAATVDPLTGELLDEPVRTELPLDGEREALLDALVSALAATAETPTDWSLAFPGPFDYERGIPRIEGLAKLDALYGVDLRAALGERLGPSSGQRMVFLNDAHAFGLGEWWTGSAQGYRRVIAVTLGTGLGSAFLDDGERVARGPSVPPDGWLYHLPVADTILDELVSSRGILRRYGADDAVSVRELAERARSGDRTAATVFAETARLLGDALTPWVERFGATCVVVGGSIANAWDLLAPSLDVATTGAQSVRARHIEHAPLLGAAVYAERIPEARCNCGAHRRAPRSWCT